MWTPTRCAKDTTAPQQRSYFVNNNSKPAQQLTLSGTFLASTANLRGRTSVWSLLSSLPALTGVSGTPRDLRLLCVISRHVRAWENLKRLTFELDSSFCTSTCESPSLLSMTGSQPGWPGWLWKFARAISGVYILFFIYLLTYLLLV